MLKTLWVHLLARFGTSPVSSLIADVEQRISHLSIIADVKRVEAKVHQDLIDERTKLKAAAEAEVARAEAVASKFKALISAI